MTRLSTFAIFVTASALALAACSPRDEPVDNAAVVEDVAPENAVTSNAMAGVPQSFNFIGGDGALLGTVTVSEDPAGLVMNVNGVAMPAGVHGIHLHEKGLCDGPRFETAGAHWNPGAKQHGRDNPAGAHAGDLANLTVAANGSAIVSIPIADATMGSGPMMLADADGTALVVHAKADDYKTDPSGNSGDRIACAVIAPPK
ncbi:MAG TPA: superoxide dismutase family protein [Sphingomicrobium sp.]|nr:superoxide dismutase family protein [Sphingomicrobium sp.]